MDPICHVAPRSQAVPGQPGGSGTAGRAHTAQPPSCLHSPPRSGSGALTAVNRQKISGEELGVCSKARVIS